MTRVSPTSGVSPALPLRSCPKQKYWDLPHSPGQVVKEVPPQFAYDHVITQVRNSSEDSWGAGGAPRLFCVCVCGVCVDQESTAVTVGSKQHCREIPNSGTTVTGASLPGDSGLWVGTRNRASCCPAGVWHHGSLGSKLCPPPQRTLLGATGEQGSANLGLLSGSSGLGYNQGPARAPFEEGLPPRGRTG